MRKVDEKFNHFLSVYSNANDLAGFKTEEGLRFTWELAAGDRLGVSFPKGYEVGIISENRGGWQPGFSFSKEGGTDPKNLGGVTATPDKAMWMDDIEAWAPMPELLEVKREGNYLVLSRKK